ncbi:putative tRNA dimethylallyltransferase [Helianthus annuus]|uniref:tRNA dimethylallyltransferase n=1 Tax=Helianthus annuus TaxID=4232 RepID=A0A251SN29_HELAN|nr:tRNA dimethylallyltransferase 9 [Helianthus annuus]KAF5771759.1 putative tRNA dimethylallyltransferase [Helianthus annuus]KAJ0496294.1 putative tRNA dimethylallyltransferase [Helianthus annuus]
MKKRNLYSYAGRRMNIFIGKFRMTSLRLPYSPPSAVSFLLHRRLFTTFQCSASTQSKKEKVIVISGPTGAGKSRLALELSKKLNGEIISADSVQVYQGLDVGSAKPSTSERQEVPHHLVDILHPSEDYSAGNFYDDGRQATKDILSRGRVPIVTGGTGLYLRWFIYGKPDVPKATSEISLEVQSELAGFERTYDWDAAVQLVTNAGDPTAQSLPANDWYRLRRKLEIIKSSGMPPSAFPVPYDSFKGETASHSTDLGIDISTNGILDEKHKDLDYDFICFFLSTSRLDLYRSIDFRCEDMISGDTGILSEARWLLDMGLQPNSNSATRAIGYRQAMEYLLNCENQGGRSSTRDFYAFLSEFQKASRNFAKRQLTWFRNEPIYHWIDASRPLTEVLDFIYNAYHDQTGKLVVPRSLAMDKEIADRREITQLKTYRTKRGVFISQEDCSDVLDWISNNQRRTTELIAN